MRDKLLILGGSGVGMLAASIAEKFYNFKKIFFLNDDPKIKYIGNYKKFKIVGNLNKLDFYLKKDDYSIFNAIINYKKISFGFKNKSIPKQRQVSLIHPNLSYDKSMVKIGKNVLICSNVTLSTDVEIGDGVKIMSNVFVGHNTIIKKNSFISASAVIGGNVSISENSFIGLNSTIIENCKVNKNCILGAGSVLTKNMEDRTIFFGNPAKKYK